MKTEWVLCPVCGSKTRNKVRADTVVHNFPLFCPKCKQETLVDLDGLEIRIIKEPDTQMQSR